MEQCPIEHQVIQAGRSGAWTEALRAHAAECPVCNPTMNIGAALHRISTAEIAQDELPASYRTLWFRAQFARREKRLSIVDLVLSLGALIIALSGLVGIILWNWNTIGAWLTGISPGTGTQIPFLIIAGCAALLWILTEELFFIDR